MREALRGALLSALFFALLVAGSPTIGAGVAHAERWTPIEGPCQGGTGYIYTQEAGCVTLEEFNHNNTCDTAGDRLVLGAVIGSISAVATVVPEPMTTALGIGGLIGAAFSATWGGVSWLMNDC